ncbi:hypothetical protein PCIT_b1206 [Pseudoalteromonas citrea]|uniref:Chitin-binding type-3 domain-containing protein n=2 Tax=Pseudoalteromonas citrea TaxID=43655 RepID=A0AAD4AFT2_9GAMM|nr:cellulase family glycosylhydrolase [Pseudoalteromonas citrea]KAF7765068.1 hypothetical protein PCIT_b1206 [Pseudoalteromonas citrea]
MNLIKLTIGACALACLISNKAAYSADCSTVNEYPNWTAKNWSGQFDHANTGDLMHYQNKLYKANWWTKAIPGSNQSWQYQGTCSDPTLPKQGAYDKHGKLAVCGTKLCNKNNQPIQLRGMSSHGLQWYGLDNCLTNQSLDVLAYDWQADIFRISLYVQEGGYETDPVGFTAQVNTLIAMASDRGMYALVDWHQLNPGDPNYNLALAKQFFTDIVTSNKHRDNVLYDIANEPNNVAWQGIRDYASEVIPVIRAIKNDAIVLVGTHGWATFGASDGGTLQEVIDNPVPFDNIMYTFHFYAASHLEFYRTRLDNASDALPVFVTEWGSQKYTGDGENDFISTQAYIDLMKRKKISWTNWNYSDDIRSGAVWKQGACRTSNFTDSQLKEAGMWLKNQILLGR